MASSSVLCTKATSVPCCIASTKCKPHHTSNISFHVCSTLRLPSSKTSSVAAKISSNSGIITDTNSSPDIISQGLSISTLLNEVSLLVKMVDSREVVELQLKQLGCELVIRKSEAVHKPQPAGAPGLVTLPPNYVYPAQLPPAQPSVPATLTKVVSTSVPPSAPAVTSPSHPPLKCPMAGTFYRSPAPGEPPFVKVGDKVQKGQIICIIEAMKLMNEIEADLSGTVEQILVEDGKPVSVDLPLLVIVP